MLCLLDTHCPGFSLQILFLIDALCRLVVAVDPAALNPAILALACVDHAPTHATSRAQLVPMVHCMHVCAADVRAHGPLHARVCC